MIKIRQLYGQTQNNSRNNFDKVTLERCKKILAYVNRQYENTTAKNDYTNLDEMVFYQDKYQQVIDKFNMAINDKTKKPKLQADIINILSHKFGQAPPAVHVQPEELINKKQERAQKKEKVENKQKNSKIEVPQQKLKWKQEILPKSNLDPKDMMQSYFDSKKTQIEKSKIGFKSVLENIPKPSQKYAIKSKIQAKKDNDQNITLLNKQVNELSKKLEQSKLDYKVKHGLEELEKKQYENRIKTLLEKIQRLSRQNQRLRHQAQIMVHSQPPQFIRPVESIHIIQPVIIKQKAHESEIHDPWRIKYRSNNIFQLARKFQGQQSPQQNPSLQTVPSIHSVLKVPQKIDYKTSQQQHFLKAFSAPIKSDLRFSTQFSKSNIRLNRSQIQNEQKNLAIRAKLSFFKPSIVLYRCDEFELAIKSVDIIPLQSRKIAIYFNNKDRYIKKASINYTCDSTYYQLKVLKKLTQVQGLKQGKEQIEIILKNRADLDYLIQAKLSINNKTLKFILPTMMIQFMNSKPLSIIKQDYQKNTIVPPMFQFSSIFSAMEILPLQKSFQDKIDVGSIYARSKYYQGFINLRWRSKIELQVETIKPWVLLISYLLYKEY